MSMMRRRDPYGELSNIRDQMNKLWDVLRPGLGFRLGTPGEIPSPRIDLHQSENDIRAVVEIPGLESKDDIEVIVTDNTLTVRGEIKRSYEQEGEGVFHSERYYGAFNRTLSLPVEVKPDESTASYKNGVLEIRMPKTEASKRRTVRVPIH
ncbi:MAG: Hsp20/alpha crystallin family protein [Bacillota bacterium]